mmetsp:Transcript_87065/g.130547  ORF Transcript_87065/g.130547 Transcript_87065/m.130547 type:complete len:120 (+) Transcript_87065:159-518(+)
MMMTMMVLIELSNFLVVVNVQAWLSSFSCLHFQACGTKHSFSCPPSYYYNIISEEQESRMKRGARVIGLLLLVYSRRAEAAEADDEPFLARVLRQLRLVAETFNAALPTMFLLQREERR